MARDDKNRKTEEDEETVEKETKLTGGAGKKGASGSKGKKTAGKKGDKGKKTEKKVVKKNSGSKGKKAPKGGSKQVKKRSERFFKMIDPETHESSGRYTGETPKQAASKGFTKRLHKYKEEGKKAPKNMEIYLRESTRGSNRKIYGYSAVRQKLDEPQELEIVDKETGEKKTITYNYRNKIHKIPVPEQIGGALKKSGKKTTKKSKTTGSKVAKASSKTTKSTKKEGKTKKVVSKKSGSKAKKATK